MATVGAAEPSPIELGDFKTSPDSLKISDRYTFDLVMTFKVGDSQRTIKVPVVDKKTGGKRKWETVNEAHWFKQETARMIAALQKAELHVMAFKSVQEDEIYVLIGADEARLRKEAERTEKVLELDPDQAISYGRKIGVKLAKRTDNPNMDGPSVTRDDWRYIFGKYEWYDNPALEEKGRASLTDPRANIYAKFNLGEIHNDTYFSIINRLKLTNTIIEAEELLGGANLSTRVGRDHSPLIAFFPLHDDKLRVAIEAKWKKWNSLWNQPLRDIREYYGEQIGIYFAFLSFYTKWLAVPALSGLIIFIWQMAKGTVDVAGTPIMAVIVVVWATTMLEAWKRREAELSAEWGMGDFLEKETARPEFEGEWTLSPATGKLEEEFPFWQKIKRMVASQTVVWMLIGVVIAAVVGIFAFKSLLQHSNPDSTANAVYVGIVNAVQIQILNVIYGMVATQLNDWENHRTDTEYHNALISKAFLFKFVNSYNSLFYIAFIKGSNEGCLNNDCLGELQTQLGTIFVSQLVLNNIIEVVKPRISRALKRRKESTTKVPWRELLKDESSGDANKSPAEVQYEKETYESTFSDWEEIVIQYGYLALFVVAFPIAPLLAMISNFLENKIDAYKLCIFHRRPLPKGAANIGFWFTILDVITWITIMTNTALVVFASTLFENYALTTRFLIFLFSEHILLLAKASIGQFIPDVSQQTSTHLVRQKYLVDVLLNGTQDKGEFDGDDEKA